MAEEEKKEEMPEKEKLQIASRGIPSSESMYLPSHNSPHLRSFEDGNENITRNTWNAEEVINFVFPKKYQEKYNSCASAFLSLLFSKMKLTGADMNNFVKNSQISKATFYNRVLPRLRRVGMIKVERETIIAKESMRKYRPMCVTLSKTFGNYLTKIGDSWLAVVDDAKSKKLQQEKLGKY
ncbi:hypothetical protein AUJ17_04080 [Candidatus Micrarchaeota archaeon CG1_02_47_40]|nr:MAG: hypothetical protein AUJ17_04080 [Candidatus Micrarchaeota archaeon CG1_02_47_40]QBM01414.1 hypothetical protein [uncultured archaeon]